MELIHSRVSEQKFGFLKLPGAERLRQVSGRTVRRWMSNGDLVGHRLGGQWRIDPKDLDTFLKIRRMA